MLTYELFTTSTGYGYVIKEDGAPWIVQEDTPDVDGIVPMTKEEAEAHAQAFIAARSE